MNRSSDFEFGIYVFIISYTSVLIVFQTLQLLQEIYNRKINGCFFIEKIVLIMM